jgi:NAD(P)-dependent dehydrogenase (short-subunit alcohol dehydrogenase family)
MAIARRISAGTTLILADADGARVETAAAALAEEGFDVRAHVVDISDRRSVAALAKAAGDLGALTQLVHTAGISATQGTPERILRIDLLGTAHLLDEFAEVISPGGSGVVIASMAGQLAPLSAEEERAIQECPTESLLDLPALALDRTDDNEIWYRISKRANQLHVQRSAITWGERLARINSISPGITSTPMALAELDGPSGDLMRNMLANSGAQRIGTPYDIAEAVAFLLGPGSTFITGTDLLVDGGVVAAIANSAIG